MGPRRIHVQRDVLRLVLHLPFDHVELAEPVRHALEVYLRAVGKGADRFSEYSLGEETLALNPEGWTRIDEALRPPRGERFLDDEEDEAYVDRRVKAGFQRWVQLSSLETGVSGYGFFYLARLPWREPVEDEVSLVSFSWPTEHLQQQGPEWMREWVLALASSLPFASGHAGLAFSSPNLQGPSMAHLWEDALRHPGLDVTHGQRFLGFQVDGVHWLNFLGPPALGALGGAETLRARLRSPGTLVQELPGARALVTLGPQPEAGDQARGQDLPAYRELARVLKSQLYPCPPGLHWRGCAPETPQRWWTRFLD